jgi:succinate dehydrogenase / fumarate reductase iron-sulfur subunit
MAPKAPSTALAPAVRSRGVVKDGRLPVSEFAFDRAGAASPFGDDLRLPLPVEQLTYVHPAPAAPPLSGHTSDLSHH